MSESREIRHVQAKRCPKTDHRRQRRNKYRPEFAERAELVGLVQQKSQAAGLLDHPAKQDRRHDQDKRSGPVLDRPQQVHSAIDDKNVQSPKQQKR